MSIQRSLSKIVPLGAILIAAAVTLMGLRVQHARLRGEALVYWRHRMDASADATRFALQAWLDERQQDTRLLARQTASVSERANSASDRADAARKMSGLITEFAAERGYRGVWMLRPDGHTAIVSDGADAMSPVVRAAAVEAARTGVSQTVGPLQTADGEQLFAVIEPVIVVRQGHETSSLGAVVVGVDPYVSLFPIVLREQDGVVTARHSLVKRVGDEFVVLTPSKSPRAGPGELRLPWALAPSSGAFAASGKDTSDALLGLGNIRVIAATRHLPETGWGIVRALDEDEAYALVDHEFHRDELFVGTLFVLGVLVALAIRRRQVVTRKRAIAESEARYRLLAEHATDLIIRRNLAGEVLYVSPACKQMLGHDPEALMTEDPILLVHPEDVATAQAAQLRAFRNPLSLPVQYRVRRSDGSYAWLETTGQPVIDPLTHELTEIVTVSRDISGRRAIEEEGRRLAQRNALLLASAAEGIFGLDQDGMIIFINPAAVQLVGWPAEEMLGKSQHVLMHHSLADGTPNALEQCGICMTARTGRGHASSDDVFWNHDGASFPVEYQSTAIRENGVVRGAVVTFRDVSARLRANLELVRAKDEAEAANAAKSDFLARMSHELRTPLNSIIGFSNVLRKNKTGNLSRPDLGYLDRIGTNGVQLLALINDILDLSKIEAGKLDMDISRVALIPLVNETLVQLGDRCYKEGVTVEAVLPEGLGTIETDATKLRQVLINLIGNAVKFTHAGTITVSVETEGRSQRPARIRVTDTGIGIPPERLAAIFVAFEQADTSTTREYGGTGLGLSISRALCEALGFRLEVESVVGKGTTFTIELSAANNAYNAGGPIDFDVQGLLGYETDDDTNDDAALVLVIEDDADARELLRTHIEELGYRVELAASGEQGLRMAQALDPQLITLDLMMSGMDGWELLKRLAASPELARIPVVIVSAIAGEMQHSFVGAVDWVNKPIAPVVLSDAIARNIDRKDGGILIIEDDPVAREQLLRFVLEEHKGDLRVASDGASALAMLEYHLPDLILLDLKMPAVDGFLFLETLRQNPRLSHLAVIVLTAEPLSSWQRDILTDHTIAVLEKGSTLEQDLARVIRRLPRRRRAMATLEMV